MAEFKYVYDKYFQKSLNYLFPLIGLNKEELFKPAGTYLWWNGTESIDNTQLIAVYEERDELVYDPFEAKVLFKNPYIQNCYTVEDGKAYIFDLSSHGETVKKFLEGKYSKFSEGVKKKILTYHGASLDKIARPGRYLHMSLYPELYWEQVGKELDYDPEILKKEVKELGSLFDREKETLSIKIIEECEFFSKKKISLDPKK
jgi:hypothetical protein